VLYSFEIIFFDCYLSLFDSYLGIYVFVFDFHCQKQYTQFMKQLDFMCHCLIVFACVVSIETQHDQFYMFLSTTKK